MDVQLDPLAIVVAAAASFMVGGLWYSPALFGKLWQRLCGLSDEQLKVGTGRVFGVALLCALFEAAMLAAFIGPAPGVGFATLAGALAGIGWVAPGFVVTYGFERRPGALALIDGGYHVVTLTTMGAILGAFAG